MSEIHLQLSGKLISAYNTNQIYSPSIKNVFTKCFYRYELSYRCFEKKMIRCTQTFESHQCFTKSFDLLRPMFEIKPLAQKRQHVLWILIHPFTFTLDAKDFRNNSLMYLCILKIIFCSSNKRVGFGWVKGVTSQTA